MNIIGSAAGMGKVSENETEVRIKMAVTAKNSIWLISSGWVGLSVKQITTYLV